MPHDPPPDWVSARRRVIGDRIRKARLHANLTQERLAGRVGVERRTVHRIEHATTEPPLGLLLLIAHELNVPLSELVAE